MLWRFRKKRAAASNTAMSVTVAMAKSVWVTDMPQVGGWVGEGVGSAVWLGRAVMFEEGEGLGDAVGLGDVEGEGDVGSG